MTGVEVSPRAASLRSRALLAAILLCAEYAIISFRYDAAAVGAAPGREVLRHIGHLPPVIITVLGAIYLVHGQRLAEMFEPVRAPTSARYVLLCSGANLAAFVALFWSASLLFEASAASSTVTAIWLASASTTLITGLLIVVPFFQLKALAKELRFVWISGLLGVVAWYTGMWAERLWHPMGAVSLRFVSVLLSLTDQKVFLDSASFAIGMSDFQVTIAPPCSGYAGMGLMTVFVGVFLYRFHGELRFPNALLLFPLALAAMWLTNNLRIASLVWVGANVSEEVALGSFHARAGWLFFCAVALGIIGLARHAPVFSRIEKAEHENPTAAYLMPLMAILLGSMLVGVVPGGRAGWYVAQSCAAAALIIAYRKQYGELRYAFSWQAPLLGGLAYLLWVVTPEARTGTPEWYTAAADSEAPWGALFWATAGAAGMAVVTPIAEELAFRGFLMRRLVAREFETLDYRRVAPWAIVVSSLLFGAMHERWVSATLAGLVYAIAARQRGKLGDAVVAHGVTNAILAATGQT